MKREKWLNQYYKRWKRAHDLYATGRYSFEEIGEKLGVTRQRASQMHKQYIKKFCDGK